MKECRIGSLALLLAMALFNTLAIAPGDVTGVRSGTSAGGEKYE